MFTLGQALFRWKINGINETRTDVCKTIPGESRNARRLKKLCPLNIIIMILKSHEYHSNDIENCIALFRIRLIRFSNLPGFNRRFLHVRMGDFLQKAPLENLQKRVKTQSKISLVLLPSTNDT